MADYPIPGNGWGQAAANNTNGFGQGAGNATNGWGTIHPDSPPHPATDLVGLTLTEGANFYISSNNDSSLGTLNTANEISGTSGVSFISFEDLTGVDILYSIGTAQLEKNGNDLEVTTTGTLKYIELDNGSYFLLTEGEDSYIFDGSGNGFTGILTSMVWDTGYPTILPQVNLVMSGQSIPQGQYSLAANGYTGAKVFNPLCNWLDAKQSWNLTWKPFQNDMMSPYQYLPGFVQGCGPEFTLAENFGNDGRGINLYKPAWGGQVFGTDSSPGKFHVSNDGQTLGEITQDIVDTMNEQSTKGIEFDAFIWMHGESDGRDSVASRDDYEMNLRRFIKWVRILTNNPNLPFIIRVLPNGADAWMAGGAAGAGSLQVIQEAQRAVADSTANCYRWQDGDSFPMSDGIHPDAPLGNDELANNLYPVIKTALSL